MNFVKDVQCRGVFICQNAGNWVCFIYEKYILIGYLHKKTVIYSYNRQHIAQKTLDNERKKLYTITVSFYAFPETEPC